MPKVAPSSFNQHIFFDPNSVYYGTDDGYQDHSLGELKLFEAFHRGVDARRRENIHLVSAIGGLYGLNLAACWQPREITFFDINPHAVAYFNVIRHVFSISSSKEDFLARLTHQDYDVEEADVLIRENLALKQRDRLPPDRGSAYKRSLENSWRYALDRFDLTKGLLTDAQVHVRTTGLESPEMARFLGESENLWIYCSNIVEFTYCRLQIEHPANAAVLSIVYPGQIDLLDLAPFGDRATEVRCEIPMSASRIGEEKVPAEEPQPGSDEVGHELAALCREQLSLPPAGKLLDVGCGWGRLAAALTDHLGPDAVYEGFDPLREQVQWAQANLMPHHEAFSFHIANVANEIYNPDGTLLPTELRFPYSDSFFDVVVMHSLAPYLRPAELEHYLGEVARVLRSGGRLLATFYLVGEGDRTRLAELPDPHAFRFAGPGVLTTEPRGHGLVAHVESYVRRLLAGKELEISLEEPGTWRADGSSGLLEDSVLAVKR